MDEMKANLIKSGIFITALILFTSCLEEKNATGVGVHPSGWLNSSSEQFHGSTVTSSNFGAENCQTCHGENYLGGTSKVSCYDSQCHAIYPHPVDFADQTSPNSHAAYIREEISWDITNCQPCHGVDYDREFTLGTACTVCHDPTGPDGPEACNTCHGNFENDAPPEDLFGNEATTFITVGAHQNHLVDTTYTTNFINNCTVCHSDVPIFNTSGHINDGTPHAELIFSSLADGNGMSVPQWNRASATCDNVYCHGAFEWPEHDDNFAYTDSVIAGNNVSVVWNLVGTNQAACGTCHGLPPTGHVNFANCSACHSSVVNSDLEIINKALHINGLIDLD